MVKHRAQNRLLRLVMGIMLPPILMSMGYVVINAVKGSVHIGLAIGWLTFYSSFRLVAIQLLVYSGLMEFLVIPKFKNIHTVAFISGLLLLLIIVSAFVTFFGPTLTPFENDRLTPVLGFVIGGLLGYGLKLSTQN